MTIPDPTTDEIDLGQLLWAVLESWCTLVVGAVSGALLGAVFFFNQPYQVEVEIRPLGVDQRARFTPLNNYLQNIKAEALQPTAGKLLVRYAEALRDPALFQVATSSQLAALISRTPEADPDAFALSAWAQFELLDPDYDEKRRTGSKFHRIQINTQNPTEASKLLQAWMAGANQKVKADTQLEISQYAKAFDQSIQRRLEDDARAVRYRLEDYRKELAQRLALLNEQADIARTLKIRKATIESVEFSSKNAFVTNVKTDSPLYLRGYEALEREITILSERKNERDFISEIIKLEASLRAAKDDPTAERISRLLVESPIGEASFKVAQYSPAYDFLFVRKKGLALFSALGVMGGGFAALLWVFVAQALRRARQSGAAPTV